MIRKLLTCTFLGFLLLGLSGCHDKKAPLDKEKFTALLIDMHRVDGTLAVDRNKRGGDELKNYAYYNDLFQKYGITKADFDSCMYYYSAQTALFAKIYDVVIDSLNKQLTQVDKVLHELKANDSVNYFPVLDTIPLDSVYTVIIDSIVPGLYKFSTSIQFDSVSPEKQRRLAAFFVSADNKDTLRVQNITVSLDTLKKNYSWNQYADSVYSRLEIWFMEVIPPKKPAKIYKKGKWVEPEKEKVVDLKAFKGKSWDNRLFRPYISHETEQRLKQNIRSK